MTGRCRVPARVRAAVPNDALALAPRLRRADLREIRAATGRLPAQELAIGILVSRPRVWAVTCDEAVHALFGVAAGGRAETGSPWFLGSDHLFERHARQFLREAPRWIERLAADFDRLENRVDVRNHKHLRWLRRVGFTIDQTPQTFGTERRAFVSFHFE